MVNNDKPFSKSNSSELTYSAYITYSNFREASLAIMCLDNYQSNFMTLKVSYGMTKYCSYFIKSQSCPNPACLYLHEIHEPNLIEGKVKLEGVGHNTERQESVDQSRNPNLSLYKSLRLGKTQNSRMQEQF